MEVNHRAQDGYTHMIETLRQATGGCGART